MKLLVGECLECEACVDKCPYAISTKILDCTHCNACVETCSKNAFYEVLPGVYSVDQNKCDGCGKCFCPYDALEIKDYARKCDLCGGQPKCIEVCIKGLSIELTEQEKEQVKALGWTKTKGEYKTHVPKLLPHEAKAIQELKELHNQLITRDNTENILMKYCEQKKLKRTKTLIQTLEKELKTYSILDEMLEDPELEEITVIGSDVIRVFHKEKGWMKTDLRFTNNKKIIEITNKMARPTGKRISLRKPRLNAVLPDGSRLHAVAPPITKNPSLTIRKFNEKLFSPEKLVQNNTFSSESMAFLSMAIQCDTNVLVCGSTGSGKTTTLNTLAQFIPLKERIIIIEEIPEVKLPHKQQVRLIEKPELNISMNKLIEDSLRMRPDKIIIGEIRTKKEAKAFINSMMAGQGKGSLSTFHALNCEEALNRLKLLEIKNVNALDLIIIQRRWTQYNQEKTKEIRRTISINEIHQSKNREIFSYDFTKDKLNPNKKPVLLKKMKNAFKMNSKELKEELGKRKKTLEEKTR